MPLRSSSTKSSTLASPYASPQPRRSSGQPKSTRQQFSACGACRMRRVRCDLKDLPYAPTGQQPQCSNCKERGLKCVDEFADVKAVKLLRRGRRLQQVEAVYGKSNDEDSGLFSPPSLTPSLIPKLRPEFFSSPFFNRLSIQHPIIDPTEFCARFFEFSRGNANALGVAGQLIAMLLVVWAASYGVNEYGIEETAAGPLVSRNRRENTNEMVGEILQLVDVHGVLRKPSWDGVRVLLLLVPLTQEIQSPMERTVMHEAVVSQVFTLCSLASVSSVASGQGQAVDTLVRARIFWYTHVVEGITSGLRGGRLLLSDEDLVSFQKTLPSASSDNMSRASLSFEFWYRYSVPSLELASACRKVHATLTGPKARQQNDLDEGSVHQVWTILDKAWSEFEDLRDLGTGGVVHEEDVERYIHGWQIFIFECHNVIREALKQRVVVHSSHNRDDSAPGTPRDPAPDLLRAAESRCHDAVKRIVGIIRQHLDTPFFEYDSTLARDGCFFAGYLLAGEIGNEEEVQVCLQALRQMRWAFSKNEEREKTVRMVWEARKASTARYSSPSSSSLSSCDAESSSRIMHDPHRPIPPPLSIPSMASSSSFNLVPTSEPSTASTEDGSWTSPPLSATSSSASHFDDPLGSASLRSSPGSNRVSSRGSPTYISPAMLHPASFSQIGHGPSGEEQRLSSPMMLYHGSDIASYPFASSHPTSNEFPTSHAIHAPQTVMTLRQHPASPHTFLAADEPHAALHDGMGNLYHQASPTTFFDPRGPVYPGESPNGLHHGSDLDQTFALQPSFFH